MSRCVSPAAARAAALSLLAFTACDSGKDVVEPPAEALAALEVSLPGTVTEGESFTLTVTAVGDQGTRPFTAFSGQVTLDLTGSAGSITPSGLTVSSGQASTAAAVVTGASGALTVRVRHGTISGSGTTTVEQIELPKADTLPGIPTDAATEAIPQLEYEAREQDFSDDHPELPGLFLSWNTLLLSFTLDVTVAQANAILVEIEATIVGGIPGIAGEIEGILTVRVPTSSHQELSELVDVLRQRPQVETVVPDVLLDADVLPGPTSTAGADWGWTPAPVGGNWGLEAIRAPQMWNLNDYVERTGRRTVTGVFDVGFRTNHPDLAFLQNLSPTAQNYHGTHVAGTIGATFDNNVGVDGVNPFASLVVRAVPTGGSFGAGLVSGFEAMLNSRTDLRVVNISMGYSWAAKNVNPETAPPAQLIVIEQGRLFLTLLGILAKKQALPLIVVSSGNDSDMGVRDAFWNSPFVWAGYGSVGHPAIIVVESVRSSPASTGGATRSSFSNLNGHVAAPGSDVMSTSMPHTRQGTFYPGDYHVLSGTSMATPHVSGLAGYLLALEPTLTHAQLRQLLTQYGVPVAGTSSRRIDAFAAAMGIDVMQGDRDLQRELVDVDDGTPDGNLRLRVFNDDPDPNRFHGDGGRRGDRVVNMRDFRVYRDAFLDADVSQGAQLDLALDGPGTHFKRDLNEDRCVNTQAASPAQPNTSPPASCGQSPFEEVHSRFTFNGSGRLHPKAAAIQLAAVAPFKIAPNTVCTGVDQPVGCLRDIDVMTQVWSLDGENVRGDGNDDAVVCNPPLQSAPPASWTGSGLLRDRDGDDEVDYIRSADLHVRADAADDDAGLVVRSGSGAAFLFSKCRHTAYQGPLSVPLFAQPVVRIDYSRTMPVGPTVEERTVELIAQPRVGEDLGLDIGYEKLDFFSTTRQRASELFDRPSQLERHLRDVGPDESGYYALAEAPDLNTLATMMFDLAVQYVLPNSLVARWLGSAEVLVPVWTQKCLVFLVVGCEKWEGRLWGASMRGKN